MKTIVSILAVLLTSSMVPVARGQVLDLGDAPEYPGYATKLSENGARHTIRKGFYMGVRVDGEPDGQPSSAADGDDLKETYNDEDGVYFLTELTPGEMGSVVIIASEPGSVSGWIDFERNKTWAEAGNRIFTSPVVPGTNHISFPVPAGAALGSTYARFRLSKQGTANYYGPADDGEVEDYRVLIRSVDFGDCPDSNRRPEVSRLTAADAREFDYLGSAVATDGDWLVAGASGRDEAGISNAGAAYMFRWNGFEWLEFQKILPSDGGESDYFGSSVAIKDEWLMIGAPLHSIGTEAEAGAVYIFRWDGSMWTQTQKLSIGQRSAHFGRCLAISGQRVLIGAPWTRKDLIATGAAYAFKFDGSNWSLEAQLLPSSGHNDDHFGFGVAIEGSHVLVGARNEDYASMTNVGSVYHFVESGGVWTEKQKLIAPEAEDEDGFGSSVALASGRAAVGAPRKRYGGYNYAGAVYCYNLTGAGWSLISTQSFRIDDYVYYGGSLAMTDDRLAVGGPNRLAVGGPSGSSPVGMVRLFGWTGTSWQQISEYSFPADSGLRQLGDSVSLGNGWLAAGAPYSPLMEAWGEAVAFDVAQYPFRYPTLYANHGARHVINPAVYLGEKIDAEPNAYASFDAQGDDSHDADDEDGISFITTLFPGRDATIAVFPSTNGYLSGWIDFNDDGDWEDPYEIVVLGHSVTSGVSYVPFLVAPDAAPREPGSPLYARFRFSTRSVYTAHGEFPDGEMEDYRVSVEPFPAAMDFGDAPDSSGFAYRTLLANHGAWHAITGSGPWMGSKPDPEANGMPSEYADGDNVGVMDEDGVVFNTEFVRGRTAALQVSCATSPGAGYLNAWIDYNRNGNWEDTGEQIIVDAPVSAAGGYSWSGTVPETALVGYTYARFRICSAAGLASYGPAVDGEVEDYVVKVFQVAPAADIVITNIQHSAMHGTSDVMWTAEAGILYQLQSTTNLPPSSGAWWSDVGSLVLGPLNWQQDTNAPQPEGFYRVVAPWVETP